ncbi:hypothetical protein [Paenibacillus ehimensis]|uniref:hypothetical protein n=1 Tax=Paenibacillus ehimensis TaxID=79264 RepID=UPI001C3F9075|nr:hypothetical protein [Paenibacillus ehimensis]
MHLNGGFSSEAELKAQLDLIYHHSQFGRSFHGILEVASNPATIVTAVHNIKSNKGAKTAGIDGRTMKRYLQMDYDELVALV